MKVCEQPLGALFLSLFCCLLTLLASLLCKIAEVINL